jgi:hypothetical protein
MFGKISKATRESQTEIFHPVLVLVLLLDFAAVSLTNLGLLRIGGR